MDREFPHALIYEEQRNHLMKTGADPRDIAGWTAGFRIATLFSVGEPKLPKGVSPFARACIDALAVDGLGRHRCGVDKGAGIFWHRPNPRVG
jgi:hypothetical protein